MPRLAFAVAVALAASALFVSTAGASHGIQYGVQDDAWLLGGPGTIESRLDLLQSLGVTTVRFSIRWDQVAPTKPTRGLAANDPAYEWGGVDSVLQGLHARGIQPVVTLFGTPKWANGGHKPNVAPTAARTFADFA